MSNLLSGTVIFLVTHIEGSTQLWENHSVMMKAAIRAPFDEALGIRAKVLVRGISSFNRKAKTRYAVNRNLTNAGTYPSAGAVRRSRITCWS